MFHVLSEDFLAHSLSPSLFLCNSCSCPGSSRHSPSPSSVSLPLHPLFPQLCSSLSSPDAKHRAESELGPNTRPRSNTLPKSFGSTLDQGVCDAAVEVKGQRPTREETLDMIQRRVKGKRQEDGWPDDIKVAKKENVFTCLHKTFTHKKENCAYEKGGD